MDVFIAPINDRPHTKNAAATNKAESTPAPKFGNGEVKTGLVGRETTHSIQLNIITWPRTGKAQMERPGDSLS